MRVYLAGGMKTPWRDSVMPKLISARIPYFNPQNQSTSNPKIFTARDLKEIRDSSIVLGYMDSKNPGDYNLAFEMGYALAYQKLTFFVRNPEDITQYWEMIETSSFVFNTLEDAVKSIIFYNQFYNQLNKRDQSLF